ncbi:MAG: hypothetical protein L3J46_06300 [Kangiellaceae bacterium]|nr:hypothetical protein [Kangiellaceae bacterium]
MFSIKSLLKILSFVTLVFFSYSSIAANIGLNADSNDVALHGYDTVAYFTQSKAVKGSDKYTATFKNAIYQFSNEVNREFFRGNPAKYAPQFGGFCGMGVAMKKKLDVDPNAFTVVDNKLYMNLNLAVRKMWSEDIPGNIKTANKNWIVLKTTSVE